MSIGIGDLTSGLIVLCALPVIPVFMILIGLATQALQRKQSDALATLGGAFTEAVEGLATLKVFGRARRQVGRIGTLTDAYRKQTIGVLRLSFVSGFALELAASLAVALVAVSIGVRLVDGSLGLGAAMFVLVLARRPSLRSDRSAPTSTRRRTVSRPRQRSSTSSTTTRPVACTERPRSPPRKRPPSSSTG